MVGFFAKTESASAKKSHKKTIFTNKGLVVFYMFQSIMVCIAMLSNFVIWDILFGFVWFSQSSKSILVPGEGNCIIEVVYPRHLQNKIKLFQKREKC